jgi:hypothetical protein
MRLFRSSCLYFHPQNVDSQKLFSSPCPYSSTPPMAPVSTSPPRACIQRAHTDLSSLQHPCHADVRTSPDVLAASKGCRVEVVLAPPHVCARLLLVLPSSSPRASIVAAGDNAPRRLPPQSGVFAASSNHHPPLPAPLSTAKPEDTSLERKWTPRVRASNSTAAATRG